MINWLHSRLFRPERGWDPVPEKHASTYAHGEWAGGVRPELLDLLDDWVGGLSGKSVLDLGAGPGQYSVAFAKRDAKVTWYDVSRRYRDFAQAKCVEANVEVGFALGYLDEAPSNLGRTFDLVFNRICWNYGRGDRSFSRVIWSLVRPGGVAYVDTTHDRFHADELPLRNRATACLNRVTCWKIGHPFPPHGRIASLFVAMPFQRALVDYSAPDNDRVLIQKPA